MSDNQVNNLLGVTMDKIKQMVDVNTVIGDPVTTPDGTTVIPVSRVSYGFASGGSDLPSKAQPSAGLFAGGSGAGITISPVSYTHLGWPCTSPQASTSSTLRTCSPRASAP